MSAHEAAIEAVYRDDGARLWRALFGFTGSRDAADDALAEAVAQALARGRGIKRPRDWIWRTAFIVASAEMQKQTRISPNVDEDVRYEMPTPIDHLVQALQNISPKQRLAIILHDYADRSTAEIAATLGTTTGTVYVHLSVGRRRLRHLLEAELDEG